MINYQKFDINDVLDTKVSKNDNFMLKNRGK